MDALIAGDETRLEQAKIPQPQQIAQDVISQPPRICAVLDFAQPVMQAPQGNIVRLCALIPRNLFP
jgi:hypothetical protein